MFIISVLKAYKFHRVTHLAGKFDMAIGFALVLGRLIDFWSQTTTTTFLTTQTHIVSYNFQKKFLFLFLFLS